MGTVPYVGAWTKQVGGSRLCKRFRLVPGNLPTKKALVNRVGATTIAGFLTLFVGNRCVFTGIAEPSAKMVVTRFVAIGRLKPR